MPLISKIIISIAILAFLLPMPIFAEDCPVSIPGPDGVQIPNPDYPCTGNAAGNKNAINDFLYKVINFLTALGGALGVLLLVVAGFFFITARGDNSKLDRARTMVLWVIIGVAVIVLARLLIGLVASFAGSSSYISPGE